MEIPFFVVSISSILCGLYVLTRIMISLQHTLEPIQCVFKPLGNYLFVLVHGVEQHVGCPLLVDRRGDAFQTCIVHLTIVKNKPFLFRFPLVSSGRVFLHHADGFSRVVTRRRATSQVVSYTLEGVLTTTTAADTCRGIHRWLLGSIWFNSKRIERQLRRNPDWRLVLFEDEFVGWHLLGTVRLTVLVARFGRALDLFFDNESLEVKQESLGTADARERKQRLCACTRQFATLNMCHTSQSYVP